MAIYTLGDLTLLDGCRIQDMSFTDADENDVGDVAMFDSGTGVAYVRDADTYALTKLSGVTMHCRHGVVDGDNEPALLTRAGLQGGRNSNLYFHATALLVGGQEEITSADDWQELGGVVTSLGFFASKHTMAFAQLSGMARAEGSGVEMRMVQDAPGGLVVFGPWAIEDTALYDDSDPPVVTSVPWVICVRVNPPGDPVPFAGTSHARLEGRINGATAGAIKHMSLSLIEALP